MRSSLSLHAIAGRLGGGHHPRRIARAKRSAYRLSDGGPGGSFEAPNRGARVTVSSSITLGRVAGLFLAAAACALVFAVFGKAATGTTYAALGDSYSSGVGTGSY